MKKIILLTLLILACTALAYAVNPDDYIDQEFMVYDKKPVLAKKLTTSSSIQIQKTYTEPATGMKFVWVPAGCFQMGSNSGEDDEKPIHEVCVNSFWMGKHEVTNAQYRKFKSSHESKSKSIGNMGNSLNGNTQPVVQVSWQDATSYANWLSSKGHGKFRLPTEAEWEYAARGGDNNHKYAGGNNEDTVSWYYQNSAERTHSVGTKLRNGFGLFDMSGNVYEWCEDWYDKNAYSKHSRKDPIYRSEGDVHVIRGGSWLNGPSTLRSASRRKCNSSFRYNLLGFRLVRTN